MARLNIAAVYPLLSALAIAAIASSKIPILVTSQLVKCVCWLICSFLEDLLPAA
jgi:hypothetical protein